ncbi:response regulator [Luteibaculum oceani]|uniref:Response regulator n=1 Tax=Luteibaculum oceani TaxID=1294296 RepID=A0A5C6VPU8_9FLAO|nr:response regulator [Luteibaculum oceani]TXC85378.1 response regulator [Luteibaculum oceani]
MGRLKSIMVVDDDEVNNFILKELLLEADVADEINIKSSVDEAIAGLSGAKGNSIPQLILLDINMPVKDGFDFLEEYYENGLDTNETRIILLTSSLFERDKAAVSKYPRVVDFVIKPLDMGYFKRLVSQIAVSS